MDLNKTLFQLIKAHMVMPYGMNLEKMFNIYNLIEYHEFWASFMCIIRTLLYADISKSKSNIKCIDFVNVFIIYVEQEQACLHNSNNQKKAILKTMVTDTIKIVKNGNTTVYYNFCGFCENLMKNAKPYNILDNDICDSIQIILLELLLQNTKAFVRTKAIAALRFLQNPANTHCKVIQSFLKSLSDISALVRKAIIESIVINHNTLKTVIHYISDNDYYVRKAIYKRFSTIRPQLLTIKERQMFFFNGFDEKDASVKRVFMKEVLPFWFKCYDTNFLNILSSICITEIDNRRIECIIEYIIKHKSFKTISECLPINNKTIAQESLNATIVLFWEGVHKYFMTIDDKEFILENFPQLDFFCDYIESFLEANAVTLLESSTEELQFIIEKLFSMLHRIELIEKIEQQKVQNLIIKSMKGFNTNVETISIQMRILEKIQNNLDTFIEETVSLALSIKENNINFELSSYGVKVHNQRLIDLKQQQEKLIENRDEAKNNQNECMNKQCEPHILRDNNSRLCRCLDILIELLKLKSVQSIPHALMEFKQSLFNFANKEYSIDVYRRVFKLCGVMAVIDVACAREYLKVLCTPISLYKHGEENDVDILETSLNTVVDLTNKYGTNIFSEGLANNTQNDLVAIEPLINTFLDILEDPCQNLQLCVCKCLIIFIYHGRFVNSQLLMEIIMRYNNLSNSIAMRESLRISIEHYVCSDNLNIITKALIEILNRINTSNNSIIDKKGAPLLNFIISLLNMSGDHMSSIQNNIFLHALQCIGEHKKNKLLKIWLHIMLNVNIKISDKQFLLNIENKIGTIISEVDQLVKIKLKQILKKVRNRAAELSRKLKKKK